MTIHFLTSQIKMHLQRSRMHNSEQQYYENNVGKVSKDGPEQRISEQRICIVNHMGH